MTAHRHAHLMAQYAQDAMETETPWTRWEVAISGNEWGSLPGNPIWGEYAEYRRKPGMTTYTVTMPEPMRKAPEEGEKYYFPEPNAQNFYSWTEWGGDSIDLRLLKRGLCFATKEDAIAAAKAMMPIKEEA